MKKSIFILALLPLLGACSSDDIAPAPDAFSDPNKTLSEVVRKLPADETLANKCINDFTFDFLTAVNDNYSSDLVNTKLSGNFVVSPVSAAISMIMAANFDDIDGDFRLSLGDALGLEDFEAANSLCGKLIPALQNEHNGGWLRIANSMWHSPIVDPQQDICDMLNQTYGADIACVDFDKDLDAVTKSINAWISQRSGGMIKSLSLEPDYLTVAYFISAMYFQSLWDTPFDAALTTDATFRGTTGNAGVKMMNAEIRTSGGSLEGYSIASLPYKNYSTRLYLILPPEGTEISEATARVFEEGFFDSLKKSMKSVKLNLALPKINIAASLETNNLFEALGISKFGSFNPLGWHGEPLGVLAAQDIAMQWDEEGTKFAAASVTDLVLTLSGPSNTYPMTMTLDRPFLFMIVNTDTKTCLLAGRICNL